MARSLTFAAASLILLALHLGSCRARGEVAGREDGIRLADQAPAAAQPEDREGPQLLPPLKEGEIIESESFDIDSGGRFSYRRSVRRLVGRLGAEVRAVDRDSADRLRVEPFQGVLVVSVENDGPASVAGLARDDVILSYGGEPIRGLDQFSYFVEETPPKSGVNLEALRDGMRQEFVVEVGSQYRVASSRVANRTLPVADDRSHSGMVLAEVTPELASLAPRLLPAERGLVVVRILPGGPAFFSEAREKDLLVDLAGQPVAGVEEYRRVLSPLLPSSRVKLTLLRGGERIETDLKLERDANREREFHIPILFSYEGKPEKREVSVLWSILFNSRTSHQIKGSCPLRAHVTEKKVGLLLDLFRYTSKPESYEVRLLWFLPFRFRTTPLDG
jgi:C-terminal processing protease CtpA/Prc